MLRVTSRPVASLLTSYRAESIFVVTASLPWSSSSDNYVQYNEQYLNLWEVILDDIFSLTIKDTLLPSAQLTNLLLPYV